MKRSANGAEIALQKSSRLIWFTALLWCLAAAQASPAPALPASPRPDLPFILNQGQVADDSVLFHTRTFSGAAFVKKNGAIVYTIAGAARPDASGQAVRALAVIEEMLLGARNIQPAGVEPASARINFLLGSPEQWRLDTPSFHAVNLPEVYEGVELELRAHANNIEKIFTIAPGADPAQIRMQLSGIEQLSVNDRGELVARSALGDIRFTKPVAWQETGATRRQSVEVAYAVDGVSFGFQLGAYDPARPLMIDPLLAGTFIGGSGADVMSAMAQDEAGNIYAAGYTDSALDFPMAPGATTNYQGGLYDAVVVKFDPQLTELLAATFLGGSGQDQAWGMAYNSANNAIYVGGSTDSSNFMGYASLGSLDGFVVKLNTSLQTPSVMRMGGSSNETIRALGARNNKIYAAGETASTNFNLVVNGGLQPPIQGDLRGATNAFAAVLDQNFNVSASGATYLGGNAADAALALAVDGNGALILAGRTSSTNFPTFGASPQKTIGGGGNDAFIAKISSNFLTLQAGTYLGGNGIDYANAVAVDISNNIYVAGFTFSSGGFPTNNMFGTTYRANVIDGGDIFLTRLNSAISTFQASTYFGGSGRDEALSLTVISDTNRTDVLFAGSTYSLPSSFTITPNVDQTNNNGLGDVCLVKFRNTLTNNSLLASTFLGGAANDTPSAIMVDAATNSIYLAGATTSSNFPLPGFGCQNANAGGASDGFIVRMNIAMKFGSLKWKYDIEDPFNDIFGLPTMGWDGTLYVAGGPYLYAVNPDGTFKWKFTSSHGSFTPPIGEASYGMGSTPAVDTNGNIYICASYDTDNRMYLYCISPTGSMNWVCPPAGYGMEGFPMYSSPAIAADGTVYVNGINGALYGVDANGTITYTNSTMHGSAQGSPAIATNGIVYSLALHPIDGSTLYAIQNNTVLWTNLFPASASGGRSSPAIGTNGTIYVCAGNNLYAVGTNGSTLRTWKTPNVIYSSPAIDSNGMIYVGSSNRLYSFNSASGITNWACPVDGMVTSSPAIDNNGNIYVADSIYLYSFAAAGQTNWKFELDDYISHHSPLIGTDGTIYMTDLSGLYAVYGPAPLNQSSPWATFSHDVLRTGNAGFDPRRYAAPTGVTASDGTYPESVAVSWNAIPNVIYYEVWRSTTNDTATAEPHLRLTRTNFMDTAIIPGEVYYYWLKAKTHVVLESDFSAGDSGGSPPIRPQAVTASKGVPTNYVHVTWQPSERAVSYDIYRSFYNDTGTAEIVTTVAGTNFDDHAVLAFPGRAHYYWVTAANAIDWHSPFSAGDGAANAGGIPPNMPMNLTAGKGLTSTNVPLAWDAAHYDVTSYVIYRHTDPDHSNAVPIATNGAVTFYNDRGTVPFKTNYYWVRATNQYGFSGYSAMDSGYTKLLPPLSVTASVELTNRVYVTWAIESTNATSYSIYRGVTTNPAEAVELASVPYLGPADTNFTDFSITLGSEYYYFARAGNDYGHSGFSPPSQPGGTFPLPPTTLEASDGTYPDIIRVTWNPSPSPGTLGYNVYRATTFDPKYATLIGAASICAFNDVNSDSGRRYYYWAAATNRLGQSKFSGLTSGWRPMPAPASISATVGTSTSGITVAWSSVPNADRYEIWRNTSNASNTAEKVQNSWPTISYHDTEVPSGIRHYYWVKAKNSEFASIFSRSANGYRSEGPADLAARSLTCHPSVLAPGAHPEALGFEFANLGPNSMPASNARITAEFYLSPTASFNPATAKTMGTLQLNLPVNAGRTRAYTLNAGDLAQLTVPQVTFGNYYLFLFINHVPPSTWSDPYLGNNRIRRAGNPLVINATGGGKQAWNDYDGDGKSDPAVYRAADGRWRVWMSGLGYAEITADGMGGPDYLPVPADYDKDGKTDPAVYRAADGRWRAWLSRSNYAEASGAGMGAPDYMAVPGDYDGDGKADPAVYRAADGRWRIWRSGFDYAETSYQRGGLGTTPTPGAYDYDAKTDPAVYNMNAASWRIWLSAYDYAEHNVNQWGGASLMPAPGDYNGDGLTDLAIYHAAMGYWFVNDINGQQIIWGVYWGGADFHPVPGDYDGDGTMDLAVYHIASGQWFVQTVAGGILAYGVTLGGPDYIPAGKCNGF